MLGVRLAIEQLETRRPLAAGAPQWTLVTGGPRYEEAREVAETPDGGLIAAGWTKPATAAENAFLVKTDRDGGLEWEREYGGSRLDRFYSVAVTADGGFVMAGRSRSFNGLDKAYVVRTDAEGGVLWERAYGFRRATGGRGIEATLDGGFIVCGWTGRQRHSQGSDLLLFKLDADGEIVWWRDDRRPGWQAGHQVAETPDGGFVVAGITWRGRHLDGLITKTDASGGIQWRSRQGTWAGWDEWHGVAVVDDGIVFSGGTVRRDRMRTWIMKTDFDGQIAWQRIDLAFGYSWHVTEAPGKTLVVVGAAMAAGSEDGFVLTLSGTGETISRVRLGGPFCDSIRFAFVTADGGVALAGSYGHQPGRCPRSKIQPDWDRDFWLVKFAGVPESTLGLSRAEMRLGTAGSS